MLVASADDVGARIELAGRTIVEIESGLTMSVFSPNGALLQTLDFPAGEALRLPMADAVYELEGEAPCVKVSTDTWSDVSPALSTGSLLTTISGFGSVALETEFAQPAAGTPRAVELLGGGAIRTVSSARTPEGVAVLITEFARTHNRRPVFRLASTDPRTRVAHDCNPVGSNRPWPMRAQTGPAAPRGQPHSRCPSRPDCDGEAYFGAGWGARSDGHRNRPTRRAHGDDAAAARRRATATA